MQQLMAAHASLRLLQVPRPIPRRPLQPGARSAQPVRGPVRLNAPLQRAAPVARHGRRVLLLPGGAEHAAARRGPLPLSAASPGPRETAAAAIIPPSFSHAPRRPALPRAGHQTPVRRRLPGPESGPVRRGPGSAAGRGRAGPRWAGPASLPSVPLRLQPRPGPRPCVRPQAAQVPGRGGLVSRLPLLPRGRPARQPAVFGPGRRDAARPDARAEPGGGWSVDIGRGVGGRREDGGRR
jgi:hypothetical protein